uniref:Uncharacterized protein n=1 Tax=Arundo donax TaxID=35708 RepID=A0A0A8ZMB6_ARUDO
MFSYLPKYALSMDMYLIFLCIHDSYCVCGTTYSVSFSAFASNGCEYFEFIANMCIVLGLLLVYHPSLQC